MFFDYVCKKYQIMYCYEYPRPCVTTDSLIFRKINNSWHILLIERGNNPFKGCWALPGGFVEMDEDLDAAAARELQEETHLEDIDLHQLYAFGAPDRDPRHRTITIAYWGIDNSEKTATAGDDAANLQWFALENLPPLAFDHDKIIAKAIETISLESK